MIHVAYREQGDSFWLEAYGHAGYSEYGKDIACCAVSTCLQSLSLRIEELTGREYPVKADGTKIHGHGAEEMDAASTVLCGLRAAAEAFPDHIELIEEHL